MWNQILEFWYAYLLGIICLCLTHYIQSFLPEYSRKLAMLVNSNNSPVSLNIFLWMAIGIIIFRTSSRLLFFWPARVLEKNLRIEMLSLLEKTPPLRYKDFNKGQIFQVINNDFEQIRAFVGFLFLQNF